jgi:hypothetical protein
MGAGKIVTTGIAWGIITFSEVEIASQEASSLGKIVLVSTSPKRF